MHHHMRRTQTTSKHNWETGHRTQKLTLFPSSVPHRPFSLCSASTTIRSDPKPTHFLSTHCRSCFPPIRLLAPPDGPSLQLLSLGCVIYLLLQMMIQPSSVLLQTGSRNPGMLITSSNALPHTDLTIVRHSPWVAAATRPSPRRQLLNPIRPPVWMVADFVWVLATGSYGHFFRCENAFIFSAPVWFCSALVCTIRHPADHPVEPLPM